MTYEQSTGYWRSGDGRMLAECYSGFGPGKNDPAFQNKVGIGPVPQGQYTLTGPEFAGPGETSPHGPYVIRLKPDVATESVVSEMGRDPFSFLVHGDSISHAGSASHGCVIPLHGKVDGEVVLTGRPLREALWSHGETEGQQLTVIPGPVPPSIPPVPVLVS